MIDTQVIFPDYTKSEGIFFAFLLAGHTPHFQEWNRLTGMQGANQRAYRLIDACAPLLKRKYSVQWSKNDIVVYSLSRSFIEAVGEERKADYIAKVMRLYDKYPKVKKGLQSKPQPLSTILSGQAINSEVADV